MKKIIAFFEIPATDFRRAVDFYETVLGVQLPTFECETEKMACFTEEGETVGAISYASNFDFLPSTHGVLIHFNCEDIEQTLEKVLLKGGKLSFPKQRLRQTIKDGLPYSRIVKETGLASMLKNNR